MRMAREEEAITHTFTNYIQTFQTIDPHATLPYFHVPCMFIPPQGVRVLATAADVEALLIQVMEGLKARSYARSELTDLHVHQMSENTALVSVSRVRYKSDGQELERLGETYTFRRTDDGWKIAVAMIHDPDTVLRRA
jgi:ketosteroid isomerase-like protein